jgi:lipoate-protein ligase A
MEIWRFIEDGFCEAGFNMAIDDAIATNVRLGKSKPTLRLYGWKKPSVTIGVFQKTGEVSLDYCYCEDIPVIRRLTGGRGILHYDELTYSFSSQNKGLFTGGLFQSYYELSTAFKKAFILTGIPVEMRLIKRSGATQKNPLCFKSLSYAELSFNGEKIMGSAQKRWRDGFLQHGSIPYSVDNNKLKKVFRIVDEDSQIRIAGIRHLIPEFNSSVLKENIRRSFEETFRIVFADSRLSSQELELAQRLALEKYQPLRLANQRQQPQAEYILFYNKK